MPTRFWVVWEFTVPGPRGKWRWFPVSVTSAPRKLRSDLPKWRRKFVKFVPLDDLNRQD